MIPSLETERLLLRGLRIDDLDAYADIYGDVEVMRHLEHGRPLDRDAAWRSMALHLGHWQLRGYGQWALVARNSDVLVGARGTLATRGLAGPRDRLAARTTQWGRGFATEAARAALTYAFTVLRAERVISLIRPDNAASIRVAERLGEHYERTIELYGGAAHVYGIRRPEPKEDVPG